uniref:Uncharacterized protein n=1 Tax=uncultured marine virus TaxID=186617 RepID=A0A0F7L4L5_9VIRU|nr:hypothetical protein [uncultured marine virus]
MSFVVGMKVVLVRAISISFLNWVYFLGKKVLHLVTLGLDAGTGATYNTTFIYPPLLSLYLAVYEPYHQGVVYAYSFARL